MYTLDTNAIIYYLKSDEDVVVRMRKFLQWIAVIPLDSQMARVAGKLRRDHRLKLADSVIAATALFTGSTLVTRNVRDFRRIPSLMVGKI